MSENIDNTSNQSPETPTQARQVITVHLQNIPLLKGLPAELLNEIGKRMIFRSYPKNSFVLHKGGKPDFLIFLLSGQLQVIDISSDGRIVGLSFLNPGDYAGELSIIDGKPRSASVVASENSLVALLPRLDARRLIYTQPLLAERTLISLATKVRISTTYRAILGIPNAAQRLYAFIQQLAKKGVGNLITIENCPNQQELASMVNVRRETVSRALKILFEQNIIEKDGKRLIIRNAERLNELANTATRI